MFYIIQVNVSGTWHSLCAVQGQGMAEAQRDMYLELNPGATLQIITMTEEEFRTP